MAGEAPISSVQELLSAVEKAHADWNTKARPWFRGEPRDVPNA